MLFNREPEEHCARRESRDPYALVAMLLRAQSPREESANLSIVESGRFENCNFDIGDLSNPPSAAGMAIRSKHKYTYGPLPMMAVEFEVVEGESS
jgi:hypothetical protein